MGIIRRIKSFLLDLHATFQMGLGIAVIVLSIAVGGYLAPLALLAIVMTAVGTFFGTFIIAGSLRRFLHSKSGLERSELDELRREKQSIEVQLEKVLNEKTQLIEERKELVRRLDLFANVTKIQPVCKLVAGEFSFDMTDFCEDKIPGGKEEAPRKHSLSGRYHQTLEFYRGVYKYSGKVCLAADLTAVNIYETDDTITIYGPFEYSHYLDPDHEEKWLLPGRREQETLRGDFPDEMEVTEITITKTKDEKRAARQVQQVRQNLRNLKIIDSMECFTDNIVVEFVKLLLQPVGKKVEFVPRIPQGMPPGMKKLGKFVSDFNSQVDNRHAEREISFKNS